MVNYSQGYWCFHYCLYTITCSVLGMYFHFIFYKGACDLQSNKVT